MQFNIPGEHKNKSGIYKIVNLINGKLYVGSAVNLQRRFQQHRWDLKTGRHKGKKLLKAVQKNGIELFAFDLIELCEKDALIEREQYWMDYNNCVKTGYNLAPKASGGWMSGIKVVQTDLNENIVEIFDSVRDCAKALNLSVDSITLRAIGFIKKKESFKLRFDNTKQFPNWIVQETCHNCLNTFLKPRTRPRIYCSRKCAMNHLRNQPWLGKKRSDEDRKKMSDSAMGRIITSSRTKKRLETRAKNGYKHSDETKRKMSESRKKWFTTRHQKQADKPSQNNPAQ